MPVPFKVFFSWQSDSPNKTNRSLLEAALRRAARQLSVHPDVEIEVAVDRDTVGVPGSPDIAETILEKIRAADLVVADVTVIGRANGRPTPNPNVLFELGYALCAKGWERLIAVANTHFGPIEDLPFDISKRRVYGYELDPDSAPGQVRGNLTRFFVDAIHAVATLPKRVDGPLLVPSFAVTGPTILGLFLPKKSEFAGSILIPRAADAARTEAAQLARSLERTNEGLELLREDFLASAGPLSPGHTTVLDEVVDRKLAKFKAQLSERRAALLNPVTARRVNAERAFAEADSSSELHIAIVNQGSQTARNVRLEIELPPWLSSNDFEGSLELPEVPSRALIENYLFERAGKLLLGRMVHQMPSSRQSMAPSTPEIVLANDGPRLLAELSPAFPPEPDDAWVDEGVVHVHLDVVRHRGRSLSNASIPLVALPDAPDAATLAARIIHDDIGDFHEVEIVVRTFDPSAEE